MAHHYMPGINIPDHVENVKAYVDAAHRRIQQNKFKTTHKKWLALEGAQMLEDLFFEQGEFEGRPTGKYDEDGYPIYRDHPLVEALRRNNFFRKMYEVRAEWGGLSELQHAATLKTVSMTKERMAERAKARAEADASSDWVGVEGERVVFALTVRNTLSFESQFGTTYISIMHDEAGNVIVYKGSKILGDRGQKVTVKATIKAHETRQGVKRTIIARPAAVVANTASGENL